MRSGNGGEGEGAGGARRENIGSWKVMGRKRPRSVLASNEERSHHFRNSRIPKQKMPATRVAAPPAEFMTSCISSRGVSQKSIVSHRGPEMYQPNQSKTRILRTRRFTQKTMPCGEFLVKLSPAGRPPASAV